MLYFKALLDGLDAMPEADAGVRAAIEAAGRRARLAGAARRAGRGRPARPPRACRRNDAQRIQRALEVWHATGRPLSSFHRPARAGRA